jgi:hypothetical protein
MRDETAILETVTIRSGADLSVRRAEEFDYPCGIQCAPAIQSE